MRSGSSRITLVGDDAETAAYHETQPDVTHDLMNNTQVFSRLDHLLAVFCIYRPGKIISTAPVAPTGPEDNGVRISAMSNHWVIADQNIRSTTIRHGFYRSMCSQLEGTQASAKYPRKPNALLTLAICKATLYPELLSSMCWGTPSQASTS
jgi:hypothetical protein